MNEELVNIVENRLRMATSGYTSEVHYQHLPNDDLLKAITVVFDLTNTSSLNTFETKELIKQYSLELILNSPKRTSFNAASIYQVKEQLYRLTSDGVANVTLTDERNQYNPELNLYTVYINMQLWA